MVVSVVVGVVWLLLGSVLTFRTLWAVRLVARVNRGQYRKDGLYFRFFDRTPFGWLQRVITGARSSDAIDRAAEEPGSYPGIVFLARAIGILGLLVGAMALGFAVTS